MDGGSKAAKAERVYRKNGSCKVLTANNLDFKTLLNLL
jgi:hypothetical protein